MQGSKDAPRSRPNVGQQTGLHRCFALTSRIEEDEPSGLGLRCAIPRKQGGNLRSANSIRARGRLRFYAANAGVAPIERALALFDSVIEVSIEFRRLSSSEAD